MQRSGAFQGYIVPRFLQITTAAALFFAIIGSFVFCLVTIGSMGTASGAMHFEQASFSAHLNHANALSMADISRSETLSVASLLAFIAFAGIAFLHITQLLLPPERRGRYRQSNALPVDQLKHRWLAHLVRSPESLRPA